MKDVLKDTTIGLYATASKLAYDLEQLKEQVPRKTIEDNAHLYQLAVAACAHDARALANSLLAKEILININGGKNDETQVT